MVSIDLDNIIHYHPPPIPKPPCKPPNLTTYPHGPSYPPSNRPVLIHPRPLPPRPPCLSHQSPQTCDPRPQSPSPAASSLSLDRDAHLNEFDQELANLEMAEFGSQETPESYFESSGETQAGNINDTQRGELYDQCGGASHNNDRSWDDLRPMLKVPMTPQDTVASSDDAETDRSSSAAALTSPIGADGSVLPNEPCPIQDPPPTERKDTQLSLSDCETEVNSVAAGALCDELPSQHNCNISRDQTSSPNPSTPVPDVGEPEPANQRLFRWSPETGAECRKSSPLPVMEENSIQLHTEVLPAAHDNHLGVQSSGDEIHSTDYCPSDESLSKPISLVLQRRKQAIFRPEGRDLLKDLSKSCSVSVIVPVTRSRGLPITKSTGASHTGRTGKRKNRARSPCYINSDDPADGDYTDKDDSGVSDIARSPPLTKRQRRTAAMKTQPAQARRESPHFVFSSPAPEEEIANPSSLQDIQTIPVRGFLTRQTLLSRVIYSCTFEEDRQPSCPHRPTKAPAYDKNLDNTRYATNSNSKKQLARATRFLPDEDEQLIELKEKRGLPWNRIAKHFPGRTKGSLQVRYSTKLKDRGTGSPRRGRNSRVTYPAPMAVTP